MNTFAQRILADGHTVQAGFTANTLALAIEGDQASLEQLPNLLRELGRHIQNQLDGSAQAIERGLKRPATVKLAITEAKKLRELVNAAD